MVYFGSKKPKGNNEIQAEMQKRKDIMTRSCLKLKQNIPEMEQGSTSSDEVFTGVFPCYINNAKYKKTVKRMVKCAVNNYLLSGETERKQKTSLTPKNKRPHRNRLCEMLRRSCT